MGYSPVEVKVWSAFACFTRPEAKVERVSYDVMTPSAARGVLEAIFWHAPMKWRVREVVVLNKVKHFSLMRNEVKSKASARSEGLNIGDERTQRHTLGLRDVAYIIRADVWLPEGAADDAYVKYRDQFRRRVNRGQCFQRPYLGCREFAAEFGPVDGTEKPIDVSEDLGLMLFDIAYAPKENIPRFFDGRLENGVLRVPQELYEEGVG
ncbi:MAG: type CRISPR-associated protein Cas5 [Capsulimonas sp.]|nr:type CRISPR-associated protein Cas5 [Capsulimonas sp.]